MKPLYNENDLITKLKTNDDTVLALLYQHFAEGLYNFFIHRFPLEEYQLKDIICDALINLSKNPQKFDASKSSLKTFIYQDVEGDIKNEITKFKRQKNKIHQKSVELEDISGNIEVVNHPDIEQLEIVGAIKSFFCKVLSNEIDRQVAWMMIVEKTRATEEYASLLNASHLPKEEKEAFVKRYKDKISVQLKRKGWNEFKEKMKRNV